MPRLEPSKESRAFNWLVVGSGLILPLVGVATAVYGCVKLVIGDITGLSWIGVGGGLIIVDMIVDTIWPRSKDAAEDETKRD